MLRNKPSELEISTEKKFSIKNRAQSNKRTLPEDLYSLRACQDLWRTDGEAGLLDWTRRFLLKDCNVTEAGHATGGNSNLWKNILKRKGTFSVNLEEVALDTMPTIMGPIGSGKTFTEPEGIWQSRVDSLEQSLNKGSFVPPPFIMTNFWEDEPTLADGNHRHAALLRCGIKRYWVIVFRLDKSTDKNLKNPVASSRTASTTTVSKPVLIKESPNVLGWNDSQRMAKRPPPSAPSQQALSRTLSGPLKRRKLCDMGSGEIVHIVHYVAKPGMLEQFENIVQSAVRNLYEIQSAVTDVRVCNPGYGEVIFILTFLSHGDLDKFQRGPLKDLETHLKDIIVDSQPRYTSSGSLMPSFHSLSSLLDSLKENIRGSSHAAHDVRKVKLELEKWFPRASEYKKYINWDPADPKKYTRNIVLSNEHMDVLLMCWPPGCASSIHDHDNSSCWVLVVEGSVVETQYQLPRMGLKFISEEMKNPSGAVGRCGSLKLVNRTTLNPRMITATYANNDIGIHRVENLTNKPAYTLHVYAPPLRKFKLFKPCPEGGGEVQVHQVRAAAFQSFDNGPGFILDVRAWNDKLKGINNASPRVAAE